MLHSESYSKYTGNIQYILTYQFLKGIVKPLVNPLLPALQASSLKICTVAEGLGKFTKLSFITFSAELDFRVHTKLKFFH